jgi:hypothetical protein
VATGEGWRKRIAPPSETAAIPREEPETAAAPPPSVPPVPPREIPAGWGQKGKWSPGKRLSPRDEEAELKALRKRLREIGWRGDFDVNFGPMETRDEAGRLFRQIDMIEDPEAWEPDGGEWPDD